jgi:uncharacterized protein DUF1670
MSDASQEMKGRGGKPQYPSLAEKNFKNSVYHLIESSYGSLGGGKKLSELLAKDIDVLASNYFVSRDFVKPGQMVINAVCKSDKPRVGKTIKDTETKPVVVTLFCEEDTKEWINGASKRDLKKTRMARILKEAFEDEGVLNLGDLSLIHLCCVSTAGRYVHAYEEENETILPYRGTVHDLGPTMTHKELIVEKFLSGKTHAQIKRETDHSTVSISNYIRGYRRVVTLRNIFDNIEISFITGMSKRLVKQYLKIGEKHDWRVD